VKGVTYSLFLWEGVVYPMTDVNALFAFGAGVLSFISPCCLPLYPAFLSYITGMSVEEIKENNSNMVRRRAILHTIFFLLGFTLIFVAIGFSTSFIGTFFLQYDDLIRQVGALLIIFFGLVTIGIIKPSVLMKDMKVLSFRNRPTGFMGSSLIGVGFAAGWTPCTGPILASVIALGVTNPNQALFYMLMYSLGFSLPFLVMAFFIGKLKWINKYNLIVIKVGGYFMIMMGVFLLLDWMTKVTSFLSNRFYDGFTGF
jgi:cytochrome c-type biogenesis protein